MPGCLCYQHFFLLQMVTVNQIIIATSTFSPYLISLWPHCLHAPQPCLYAPRNQDKSSEYKSLCHSRFFFFSICCFCCNMNVASSLEIVCSQSWFSIVSDSRVWNMMHVDMICNSWMDVWIGAELFSGFCDSEMCHCINSFICSYIHTHFKMHFKYNFYKIHISE